MSMYADYLREKTQTHILETDKGWATYQYLDAGHTVYIMDIYVVPEFRRSMEASLMADKIVEEAKSKGACNLLGSVKPSSKDSTTSLKVLLGYGMHLLSSNDDIVFFGKDI